MGLKYSDVIVSPVVNNGHKVIKSFTYKDVTIPKGYISNGANIPRIFWSIFPPNKTDYLPAVIIHDFLCEKSVTLEEYNYADNMLRNAMTDLHISKNICNIFYYAVTSYHHVVCYTFKKIGLVCSKGLAYVKKMEK